MAENSVAVFSKIQRELEKAKDIKEVLGIRDKAEALRVYHKRIQEGGKAQNKCAEIKVRAERRAGELLAKVERGHGPGRGKKMSHDGTSFRAFLKDNDIGKNESSTWQRIAELPEETVEGYIQEHLLSSDSDSEITTAGLLALWRSWIRQQQGSDETPPLPPGLYRCIVIDPPWPMEKIDRKVAPNQGIALDYPTMTLDEIQAEVGTHIKAKADPDGCHVYLWTTHKFIRAAFQLFQSWGVSYECILTWVKNFGITPYSWMYNTEHVLFGRIGSLAVVRKGLKVAFEAPVTKHSEKPQVFYDRVIQASPEKRLDLFARKQREGFDVWGAEVEVCSKVL